MVNDLRQSAIIDAQRRISALGKRLVRWTIFVDGESHFIYQLNVPSILYVSFNEYATLREVGYIVKRFGLSMSEVQDA